MPKKELSGLDLVEQAAPGTPGSGFLRIYAKSDGKLYYKDDAGLERVLDDLDVRAIGGGKESLFTESASGATETIDLANGNVFDITLSANCTFTFTGATASKACSFTLILRQDGTGSRLATWPASVDWSGSVAPTLSTGVNKVDVLTFLTVDSGTTWLGFLAGIDLR